MKEFEGWCMYFWPRHGMWVAHKDGVLRVITAITEERLKLKITEFNETGKIKLEDCRE